MAEAHQPPVAGLHALDERRNPILGADFGEHDEHGFIGAAVQRPIERGDAGGYRGKRVDA